MLTRDGQNFLALRAAGSGSRQSTCSDDRPKARFYYRHCWSAAGSSWCSHQLLNASNWRLFEVPVDRNPGLVAPISPIGLSGSTTVPEIGTTRGCRSKSRAWPSIPDPNCHCLTRWNSGRQDVSARPLQHMIQGPIGINRGDFE